jgi:hypothetical protein
VLVSEALGHDDLDGLTVLAHGATTASTGHDGVVATATTTAGVAVVKVVVGALLAGVHAVLALEDTGLHVGNALGALGADVAALHVDVAGDVESTLGTEGDFPPGVVDTTPPSNVVVREDGCASRRHALLPRELDRLAGGNLDRDIGLCDLDGHTTKALRLPAEQEHIILRTVVDELGLPLAVTANPDTVPFRLLVLSSLATELLNPVLNAVHEVINSVADGVTKVLKRVTDVTNGVARLGGGGGRLGLGGGRGLLLGGVRGGLGLSLYVGNLSLRGGRRGGCWSRGGEDGAPVDVAEIVCDLAPVNFVGSTALDLTTKS